jgi:TIGR01125: MiaB-like tRNA modifying enzyme YliG, TIGR01125
LLSWQSYRRAYWRNCKWGKNLPVYWYSTSTLW